MAAAGAVVLLVAGMLLAGAGVVEKTFPPVAAGQSGTVIRTYSGPLLSAAIGIGALAGLLLVATVTDLWRRRLIGPDINRSHAGLGQ